MAIIRGLKDKVRKCRARLGKIPQVAKLDRFGHNMCLNPPEKSQATNLWNANVPGQVSPNCRFGTNRTSEMAFTVVLSTATVPNNWTSDGGTVTLEGTAELQWNAEGRQEQKPKSWKCQRGNRQFSTFNPKTFELCCEDPGGKNIHDCVEMGRKTT